MSGLLSGILGAVGGFITGGPIGAIAGGISGLTSHSGGGGSSPAPSYAPSSGAMPGGFRRFTGMPVSSFAPPDPGGTYGGTGYPSGTGTTTGPGGLVCQAREAVNPNPTTKAGKPRHWRGTKNGGCTWHKKPSMNAMNPHAARRAVHRITKARRLLFRIESSLPRQHKHHIAPHHKK